MSREETVTLYRPVGQAELDLIRNSDWCAFPPRLSFQPIFYPVTNEEYAIQIARDWNTKDPASGYVGYVTRFDVRKEYLDGHSIRQVGGSLHTEYWIPAGEMDLFNANLVGPIEVIHEFRPPVEA